MKNEYSFEHFQKRREDIKNRTSRTKQTVLRLFLTTFSIVLFAFLVLATIMSPHLNIPALNDDKDNVSDTSSSDFKSRIDYRLKQIQVADGTNAMQSNTMETNKEIPEEGKLQNMLSGAQKMQDDIIKVDLSTFEAPQLPNKIAAPPSPTFKNNSYTSEQYAPPKPKALSSIQQTQQQQVPTPYVPKTQLDEAKSYKLLVGNYSSPEEAQNVSDIFSSGSAGKTHIKSYNGIYCVQVGSYSDFTKAQNIANAYRSKNYKVRVVEE